MKPILILVLLGLAAFCAFGFVATFEPIERDVQLAWRTAYGVVGLAALAGMALLLVQGRGASEDKGSGD